MQRDRTWSPPVSLNHSPISLGEPQLGALDMESRGGAANSTSRQNAAESIKRVEAAPKDGADQWTCHSHARCLRHLGPGAVHAYHAAAWQPAPMERTRMSTTTRTNSRIEAEYRARTRRSA